MDANKTRREKVTLELHKNTAYGRSGDRFYGMSSLVGYLSRSQSFLQAIIYSQASYENHLRTIIA